MMTTLRSTVLATALLLGMAVTSVPASDWPHWLGPHGDNLAPAGESFDPDLSKWKVAWTAGVGRGYSSVVVANGRAVTLGHDQKSQETVFCFDATSGQVLWKHAYDAKLLPVMHPGGPNATPTVVGDRVIIVSKDGQVHCLSAEKGDEIWSFNLVTGADLKLPQWGFASSPVIDGNQVLLSGGKVVALDLASGKVLWTSKTAYPAGYTTVVPFESAGKKALACLDGKGLSILTAAAGEELARYPFSSMFDMTATTPMILAQGKRIFISGNTSSVLLSFDNEKLSSIWTSKDIKNAMNNSVIFDGVLYGIDGAQGNPSSRLVSINLEDGKVNWAKADFGYGNTIGIGSMLLALTENGELVTAKPSASAYAETARKQVLGKLCWTTPVYAEDRIFVRNDRGEVVCLSRL